TLGLGGWRGPDVLVTSWYQGHIATAGEHKSALWKDVDTGEAGTLLTQVLGWRRPIEEPVRRASLLGAVLGLVDALWHRERGVRPVGRGLGVEHALVPDGRSAGHTIDLIHRCVIVVAHPDGHCVVHGIAHGPVVFKVLASAGLGGGRPRLWCKELVRRHVVARWSAVGHVGDVVGMARAEVGGQVE